MNTAKAEYRVHIPMPLNAQGAVRPGETVIVSEISTASEAWVHNLSVANLSAPFFDVALYVNNRLLCSGPGMSFHCDRSKPLPVLTIQRGAVLRLEAKNVDDEERSFYAAAWLDAPSDWDRGD